jgi:hypothetical protein
MATLNDPSETHGRLIAASKVNGNRCGHSTLATRPARDEITRAWQARSGV